MNAKLSGIKAFIVLLFLALLGWLTSVVADDRQSLRLATTTSIQNSGLLKELIPRFEEASGYRVELIVVGSGAALRLGRSGEVDAVLVHSPAAETAFMREGFGRDRAEVMRNDFIVVGPHADPAGIKDSRNAAEAVSRIASRRARFVSRGDDSGTNKKETALWQTVEIDPFGNDWYFETGTDMAETLKTASRYGAYSLCDRGTWLALRKTLELTLLVVDRKRLNNTYSIIVVSPKGRLGENPAGARELLKWITSEDTQRFIGDFRIDGEQLYVPVRRRGD